MKFTLSILTALCLAAPLGRGALVIGGFDTGRVGIGSIDGGILVDELKAAITREFPDAKFVTTGLLTPEFLSTVDFLFVGAPTTNGVSSGTTPLSPEEQRNLLDYVKAGGGAFIFADNDTYAGVPASDNANETYMDPFGIDATGERDPELATATNSTHPVMNGPFGKVTTISTSYAGWFNGLGPYAEGLASLGSNGQPAVLAIAPGALSPQSGGVVFISDADALVDSAEGGRFGAADNEKLVLNSIAYAIVPEPSVVSAVICASGLFAARRMRSR